MSVLCEHLEASYEPGHLCALPKTEQGLEELPRVTNTAAAELGR